MMVRRSTPPALSQPSPALSQPSPALSHPSSSQSSSPSYIKQRPTVVIRTVKRSSDRIDLLQHHRSLTACIEYIIDRKHIEESQADGESHKTMRVVTSLSSGSMYRSDYTIDNARSHGSSISWSLAGFSCGFISYLRVHEASSCQTLNVESYIRKDVQYHGLVHELMKIRKRKKN